MPGEFGKKLGRRVAELRKRAGLTQLKLAEKVDVAVETISRLERGVTIPGVEKLAEIAEATGNEAYQVLVFPKKAGTKDRLVEEIVHVLRQLRVGDLQLVQGLIEAVRLAGRR